MEAAAPAAEQTEFVRFWNDILAPKFIRFKHVLVDGLGLHSDQALPKLGLRPGMTVLDAACGFGDTACQIAEAVGPGGRVLGVDCCDAFLDFGRAEARAKGLENVRFQAADLQSLAVEPEHDLVFSRFGTMFFDNPVWGMKTLARALKPGGRLAIMTWRARADNPAWMNAKDVLLRHLPEPGADADTCGPGPFSQADPEVLTAQLTAAGFTDIALERTDADVVMGRDADDAIAFQLALGPAGEIYREAGDLATQKHDVLVADLCAMYAPFEKPEGIVMPSSSWLATARLA